MFEYDPAGSLINALSDLEQVGRAPIWEVGKGNILKQTDRASFENDKRGPLCANVDETLSPRRISVEGGAREKV